MHIDAVQFEMPGQLAQQAQQLFDTRSTARCCIARNPADFPIVWRDGFRLRSVLDRFPHALPEGGCKIAAARSANAVE